MAALSVPLHAAVATFRSRASAIESTFSACFSCAFPSMVASSSVGRNIQLLRAIATQVPPTVSQYSSGKKMKVGINGSGQIGRLDRGIVTSRDNIEGMTMGDPFIDARMGVCGAASPLMRLVTMSGVPILQQLQLEEWLLRRTTDNWCIINDGTTPSIVMGAYNKLSELAEVQPVLRDRVPVVRRFSGGGTVIVDQGTVVVSLICNNSDVAGLRPYARDIMSWSSQLYGKVFDKFGEFHLRENDYVFSQRKFGGNAQLITRKRWVHHTSFLWDYDAKSMDYIKIPKRAPGYRLARNHLDFLCRMKDYIPSRSIFIDGVTMAMREYFSVQSMNLEKILSYNEEFVPRTKLISQQELEEILVSKGTT